MKCLSPLRRGPGSVTKHTEGGDTLVFYFNLALIQTSNDKPRTDRYYTKGAALIARQGIAGPLAALSLTPIHSLRLRLVRSRQYARIFEIWKSRKMVSV